MDPSKLSLEISGPLLGKILHERHKHGGSCGGMLYGEVISETRCEITDSQHITKSEAYVCVKDYFSTSSRNFLQSLYVKKEAWSNDQYSSLSPCIGLFKVRSFSSTLSLLEKSIHKKLRKDLQAKPDTTESDFIVSLLITYGTNTDATCLDWKIRAFVLHKSSFSTIKIRVTNLQGSVNHLYLRNTQSSAKSIQSTSASQLLNSFQTKLTGEDNGIQVVDATGKVTEDLIKELDRAFEKLLHTEQKLEKVMTEKSDLISTLKTLLGKKISLQKPQVTTTLEETKHNSESWSKRLADIDFVDIGQTESEYQSAKRRSIEDMQRRSPVVVLERLENPHEQAITSNDSNLNSARHDNILPSTTRPVYNSILDEPLDEIMPALDAEHSNLMQFETTSNRKCLDNLSSNIDAE